MSGIVGLASASSITDPDRLVVMRDTGRASGLTAVTQLGTAFKLQRL